MTQVTIVERNNQFILIDNGVETDVTALAKPDKHTGELWIKLPDNSANRQWCSVKKLRKLGGTITYDLKQPRAITNQGTRKGTRDWLNEEDQKLWDELIAKAETAKKAAAKKPMTEIEKLQAKIARDQAKLEAAKAAAKANK